MQGRLDAIDGRKGRWCGCTLGLSGSEQCQEMVLLVSRERSVSRDRVCRESVQRSKSRRRQPHRIKNKKSGKYIHKSEFDHVFRMGAFTWTFDQSIMSMMMMMMTLGGAVCPARHKTDNSCLQQKRHSHGCLVMADTSTQELRACPLWNMESSSRLRRARLRSSLLAVERGRPVQRGSALKHLASLASSAVARRVCDSAPSRDGCSPQIGCAAFALAIHSRGQG